MGPFFLFLFGSFLLIFDSKVEECEVDEVCVDKENKVVTTPAFMYDATFAQVGESMQRTSFSVSNLNKSEFKPKI